ncbi:hypothetical protein [Geobacillus sp. B4113_201601]|uniref:hypothetical protein n=1 Tax=Geobacillus sp. B4113_201601 TaxID=1586290 RepID=UPI000785D7E4|nr:hypothetical protein [Geobacillus sp. B4113_201601]
MKRYGEKRRLLISWRLRFSWTDGWMCGGLQGKSQLGAVDAFSPFGVANEQKNAGFRILKPAFFMATPQAV